MFNLTERLGLAFLRVIVVGIYILSQKCDFFKTFIAEEPDFIFDGGSRAAALPAARERDDTEAAHVVTATHNGDPGMQLVLVLPYGYNICVGLIERQLNIHGALILLLTFYYLDQPG